MHTLKRRLAWIAMLLLIAGAGYTAGFLLSPPERQVASNIEPAAPLEAPRPQAPSEPAGDV